MITGYLGLDLGGTGAKAAVYDSDGKLLGAGQSPYDPITSAEGHTEIPINDIYCAARDAVRQAVASSRADVTAMAISSQGQTFVALDGDDQPLYPVIMWYDSRASKQAEVLNAEVRASCINESVPYVEAIATAPKIMWLKEHFSELMESASRYLLLPEYFSYRLTGLAVTDPCTASSTGLYADDAQSYCREALEASGIDESQVAVIKSAGTPIGVISRDVADEWGLGSGVLLVVGTNDQYAGAIGAGNCCPGIITETTGTCLALVTLTETLPEPMPVGLLGGRFPIEKYRFALAYSKTAGVTLDWYKKFIPGKSLTELDGSASDVPIGSHGVTFLPHFDGTVSPVPNPDARGFICNLSLNHTPIDIYRSILESLSFSLRENTEFLKNNGFRLDVIRSIGGGAKSDLWLQMKADVCGIPVERPKVTEAATLGASMIAAVGMGVYSSIEECSKRFYHTDRTFIPQADATAAYEKPYWEYRKLCSQIYFNCGGDHD
ncbi:MAG: FGGY-family carbohydrate kinase [Armatimonadota bacterium]